MSNAWDIHVKTCADCPLHTAGRCEASRFMPYLDETRVGFDLSASLAGAPPPDGCPLGNGEMRIEIRLDRSAHRCPWCHLPPDQCYGEAAWQARRRGVGIDAWQGMKAACLAGVESARRG